MPGRSFRTLDEIHDPARVLARVDLNSPVEDGEVQDNRRFSRHAETISELAEAGHRVALLAHQGRPGGADFVSLDQHASILAGHLDRPVAFSQETVGVEADDAIERLSSGDVLLLENVRMEPDELADRSPEEHARSGLVRRLAAMADVYVGDAYSVAHRAHASMVGIPLAMGDAYAGRVMEQEYLANTSIQSRTFDGPVAMVLGGTKADDLIRVIDAVAEVVDRFLLGGVIGELFLRADGHDVGFDVGDMALFDDLWAAHRGDIRDCLDRLEAKLSLPVDLAYADDEANRAERSIEGIRKEHAFLDIGRDTIGRFREELSTADAVFVKGAVGVFEDERFKVGTVQILEAIAESEAFSVVGGGDTSRAIDLYGLEASEFDHVSIAGGAYVRALAGEALPGIEVLKR